MSRPTLGIAILTLAVLAAGTAAPQEARIVEAYRLLDDGRDLDDMERHRLQVGLLNATLDATEKSLELIDQSSLIVERVVSCGMLVVPDEETSRRLQSASMEVRQSAARVLESWPARGVNAALSARKYASRLDGIDAVLNDPSLPPDTARALAGLRSVGEVMRFLGDVPVVGAAVDQYGELTVAFSESLRRNHEFLSPGKIDRMVLPARQASLIRGWPGDFEPHETQVLQATRWEVPLFCDGNGPDHYLNVGGRWEKVDGEVMTSLVSDWLIAYGRPEESLLSSAKAHLEDLLDGVSATDHWEDPALQSLFTMATRPGVKVHGLTRRELREKARERLRDLADEREMRKVLEDVPRFQEGLVDLEWYRDRRHTLRTAARWMGVPLSPDRERVLLREFFLDQERVETALRTTGFKLSLGAEDYVRGLDIDPWTADFWDVAIALSKYRTDEAFVTARVEVREAGSNRPVPSATVRLVRAITLEGQSSPQTGPLGSREALTGADGVADLRVLRGHHFISAEASGFDPHSLSTTTALLDGPVLPTVVALSRSDFFEEVQGSLEAHVLDGETGEAIPGARVRLEGRGRLLEATSDGEGTARIESVPYGTWTLSVEADGYQGRSRGGFEVRPDRAHRRGALRLQRIEEEIRPARLPKARLEPPAPGPDPKACGFQALGEWTDRRTAEVVDRAATNTSAVGVGATHRVDLPGSGRIRVTLTVSGRHDNANTAYGSQRFRSRVLLRSDATVAGDGWMPGGEYWPGVRDSDETSDTFPVVGPGPVSLQFVPEACELRRSQEGAPCWYPGASEAPGLKVHPMSYSLKVEFDPCDQE